MTDTITTKVLCLIAPIKIHPFWERLIAGHAMASIEWNLLPAWKKLLLTKSYGEYVRSNPRSDAAMTGLCRELLLESSPDATVHVITNHSHLEDAVRDQYDLVVLAYPDAIGLGWRAAEKTVRRLRIPLIAITGRRRVFNLSDRVFRRLFWRRFLERTWIVEIALIMVLVPIGIACAVWDALTS